MTGMASCAPRFAGEVAPPAGPPAPRGSSSAAAGAEPGSAAAVAVRCWRSKVFCNCAAALRVSEPSCRRSRVPAAIRQVPPHGIQTSFSMGWPCFEAAPRRHSRSVISGGAWYGRYAGMGMALFGARRNPEALAALEWALARSWRRVA